MREFTPAPGYRDSGSGNPMGVGYGGFSWISTVNGIYGMYLYFYVTALRSSGTYYRAGGLQLRCLSE